MNAPTLFDAEPTVGRVRPTDPPTSVTAAKPRRLTLRARVLDVMRRYPAGLTDWEIAIAIFHDEALAARRKPSVGKRRQELGCAPAVKTQWMPDSAPELQRVTRRSPDGFDCQVWVLPADLREVA